MKKLTASIFASLLTVVTVGAANANIASQGYVDEKVGTVTTALGSKADQSALDTLSGRVDTAEGEIDTLQTDMAGKANTADLGDLATLDAVGSAQITDGSITTADIADKAVTEAKLSDSVNASLDKADSALQQADLADYAKTADVASTYETKANASATYETKANASATYETKANASATYETKTNAAATYATKEEIADLATDENLALKQDKTDNNLATTNKTVVGAINEVKTTADGANSAASAAQTAADEAQADATQALEDAAAAQTTANAAIPKVNAEGSDGKYVLTATAVNGTATYKWELIARESAAE